MVLAIITTAVCVIVGILIHLSVLRMLWWYARRRPRSTTGIGIAALVLGCIIGHLLEIAVFTIGLFVTASLDGDIKLAVEGSRFDHLELWFYSASFYTSLGGPLPPSAAMRVFAACETVTGLILITWTASFLFLLMQKTWPNATSRSD